MNAKQFALAALLFAAWVDASIHSAGEAYSAMRYTQWVIWHVAHRDDLQSIFRG